jgi:hypothetical protein
MAAKSPATVICHYRVKAGKEPDFLALLDRHWPALHRLGLVTDDPSRVYRGQDDRGKPMFWEIFDWSSEDAAGKAHAHPEIAAIWEPMDVLCESREGRPNMEFPHVARVRFAW